MFHLTSIFCGKQSSIAKVRERHLPLWPSPFLRRPAKELRWRWWCQWVGCHWFGSRWLRRWNQGCTRTACPTRNRRNRWCTSKLEKRPYPSLHSSFSIPEILFHGVYLLLSYFDSHNKVWQRKFATRLISQCTAAKPQVVSLICKVQPIRYENVAIWVFVGVL